MGSLYGLIVRSPLIPPPFLTPHLPWTGPVAIVIVICRLLYSLAIAFPLIISGYLVEGCLGARLMPRAEGKR